MPSLKPALISALQGTLHLDRAVETGTFRGDGARLLAASFAEVITIELSEALAAQAAQALSSEPSIRVLQGHSVQRLAELRTGTPTLWFLDGHWSGGPTAGADDECPVLEELDVIANGHPDDVVVIDDARLFAASPPPPHDPEQWPTLLQVIDRLRARWPAHHITLLDDQLLAVPGRAKSPLDRYGQDLAPPVSTGLAQRAAGLLGRVPLLRR